mmetsp:Transcript_37816/g.75346  ORF Transcript_37816/g.75346 Transcript_37816/m.75346 type:complete len:114 (-) Transcript_37816:293-634(-)
MKDNFITTQQRKQEQNEATAIEQRLIVRNTATKSYDIQKTSLTSVLRQPKHEFSASKQNKNSQKRTKILHYFQKSLSLYILCIFLPHSTSLSLFLLLTHCPQEVPCSQLAWKE